MALLSAQQCKKKRSIDVIIAIMIIIIIVLEVGLLWTETRVLATDERSFGAKAGIAAIKPGPSSKRRMFASEFRNAKR